MSRNKKNTYRPKDRKSGVKPKPRMKAAEPNVEDVRDSNVLEPIKGIPPQARGISKEEKNEILRTAREVVDLYKQLNGIFGEVPQRGTGHNRSPDELEIAKVVKNDTALADATATELRQVIQKDNVERSVIKRIRQVFISLRDRAKKLGGDIKTGMLKYIGEGIGKGAAESYVPVLINKLGTAIVRLVQLLKDML